MKTMITKNQPVKHYTNMPIKQLKIILINTQDYEYVGDFGYVITHILSEGLGQIIYKSSKEQEVQLITTKRKAKIIGTILTKFIKKGIRRVTIPMSKQRLTRIIEETKTLETTINDR